MEMVAFTCSPISKVLDSKVKDYNHEEASFFGIDLGYETQMRLLKYLKKRNEFGISSDYIFITKSGKPVYRTQVKKNIDKALKLGRFNFAITSPMIQWSFVRSWLNVLSRKEVLERITSQNIPKLLDYVGYVSDDVLINLPKECNSIDEYLNTLQKNKFIG